MSIAIIILSDVSDPSLLSQLNMFNMWILAKYAVILRVVGMNCTRDGASENHDAPTFKKSTPRSSQNHTASLTYSATNQMFRARFLKEDLYAYQGCIYLI